MLRFGRNYGLEVTSEPRQIEVLECLVHGLNNQEIADRLYLNTAAVRSHMLRIYDKRDVKTRAELLSSVVGPGESA
jgi:DNA-binding CsgD family transcriptional regulator